MHLLGKAGENYDEKTTIHRTSVPSVGHSVRRQDVFALATFLSGRCGSAGGARRRRGSLFCLSLGSEIWPRVGKKDSGPFESF